MAEKQSQQTPEQPQIQKPEGGRAQAQPAQGREQGREPERGIERRGQQPGTLGRARGFGGSPFTMMRRMMEDMDRLFEDFGLGSFARTMMPMGQGVFGERGGGGMEVFSPAVEVLEREGKLIVRADLPGMNREDIHVNIDEDGLVLEGERKSEREEKREGYYQSERSYGSFQRRIPLPRGVNPQTCDASFENGVLEISLELPKESRRKIEVRSGAQGGGGGAGAPTKH